MEQEGRGAERQNLNKKLNAERDMERITGTTETSWEKAAVGKKTEMVQKTVQTEKRMAETQKRTVQMWKTIEGTWKTVAVNKKM
jgi:hypothetical protein